MFNIWTTLVGKKLVPPFVDERYFEIIPYFGRILSVVVNSHTNSLAEHFSWIVKVYVFMNRSPAVLTPFNVLISVHFACTTTAIAKPSFSPAVPIIITATLHLNVKIGTRIPFKNHVQTSYF